MITHPMCIPCATLLKASPAPSVHLINIIVISAADRADRLA